MKKIALILIPVVIAVAIFVWIQRESKQDSSSVSDQAKAQTNSASHSASSLADSTKAIAPPLPPTSQAEIERCLGTPATDMESFQRLALEKMGPLKNEALEAKSISFEDGDKRFWLSLTRQASPGGNKEFMEFKLFELDQENLPNLVKTPEDHRKNPSDQIIESYLAGKRITKIEEKKELEFEGGLIHLETDNDSLKTLQIETKKFRLSCGTKFESSCKCSLN